MSLHVVAVRADRTVQEGLRALGAGVSVSEVGDWTQLPAPCDLVVGPSGDDAFASIRDLRERSNRTPALLIAPTIGPELLDCLRLGVVDFVGQPVAPGELSARARALLDRRPLDLSDGANDREAWGPSVVMRRLFDEVRRIARTEIEVLITGETGTGKELVARAIHQLSPRANGPFVAVDCGAIPAELMEAELFGHERGAFTGAVAARPGLLEVAAGGTFFLDEVGELAIRFQAKLLRVLQERRVRRIGARKERPIDVRIVAATMRDLEQAVVDGTFRRDFLFRINAVRVVVPPLRSRGEDVVVLAERFAERFVAGSSGGFAADALEALRSYDWPGNVRELQNVVKRALALRRGPGVSAEDLPESVRAAGRRSSQPEDVHASRFFALRDREMARFEREYLVCVLQRCRGDVRAAAAAAALPRATFYRLLKKYALRPRDFHRRGRPPRDPRAADRDSQTSIG